MSLDVSPDAKTIVFDLLGDIYTVPIGGGSAKRITSGSGFDGQPRFAPDGKSIVFVSDRSGSENLYLVDPEGQRVRPLTTGRNQAYVSPDFTPDGQYIVVSRSNDLWLYHKDGGSGLRLRGRRTAAAAGRARRREPAEQLHGRVRCARWPLHLRERPDGSRRLQSDAGLDAGRHVRPRRRAGSSGAR
jgi:dipeptidyl aminopeptidase/acylaminoacyl peptidase